MNQEIKKNNYDDSDDGSGISFVGVSVSFLGTMMLLTFLFIPITTSTLLDEVAKNIDTIIQEGIQKTAIKENLEDSILSIYRQKDGRIVFITNDNFMEAEMLSKEIFAHINMLFYGMEHHNELEIEIEVNKKIYPNADYQLLFRQAISIADIINASGVNFNSYKIRMSEKSISNNIIFAVGPQTDKEGIRLLF